MNDINLDLVLNDIQSKLLSPKNSKIEESDITVENEEADGPNANRRRSKFKRIGEFFKNVFSK